MAISQLPVFIKEHYEVHEWKHACAVLATDFPDEWADITSVLTNFRLPKSHIIKGGGSKGPIAMALDGELLRRGWTTKTFDTKLVVDGIALESPTHEIDCFRNGIALEIEWNNKDPFFDRDLNNFRLLFDLRAVSVGIIITRCTHLHSEVFRSLPKEVRDKYGASTTHMNKLLPRLRGGGGGGCPVLAFGISKSLWIDDITDQEVRLILADKKRKKQIPEMEE